MRPKPPIGRSRVRKRTLPEIEGEVDLPDLEAELMDAATQEAAAELRRAHLADAMAERPDPETLRSSYDSLRDDYAAGGYEPADIGAAGGQGLGRGRPWGDRR